MVSDVLVQGPGPFISHQQPMEMECIRLSGIGPSFRDSAHNHAREKGRRAWALTLHRCLLQRKCVALHVHRVLSVTEETSLAAATSQGLSRPTTFPRKTASNPGPAVVNGLQCPDRRSPSSSRADIVFHTNPDAARHLLRSLSSSHAILTAHLHQLFQRP